MIETGQRVLLIWEGKEYYVRAGEGTLSTDKGIIDLNALLDASPGETIETHLGVPFYIRIPPADRFLFPCPTYRRTDASQGYWDGLCTDRHEPE